MSKVKARCHCGAVYTVSTDAIGKQATCKSCGEKFSIHAIATLDKALSTPKENPYREQSTNSAEPPRSHWSVLKTVVVCSVVVVLTPTLLFIGCIGLFGGLGGLSEITSNIDTTPQLTKEEPQQPISFKGLPLGSSPDAFLAKYPNAKKTQDEWPRDQYTVETISTYGKEPVSTVYFSFSGGKLYSVSVFFEDASLRTMERLTETLTASFGDSEAIENSAIWDVGAYEVQLTLNRYYRPMLSEHLSLNLSDKTLSRKVNEAWQRAKEAKAKSRASDL